MRKKILLTLLCFCMAATLLPAAALAAEPDRAIRSGTGGISGCDSTDGCNSICSGCYPAADNTGAITGTVTFTELPGYYTLTFAADGGGNIDPVRVKENDTAALAKRKRAGLRLVRRPALRIRSADPFSGFRAGHPPGAA